MTIESKPRVLYIVYWGAAEPLGQSLVLPAVKKLARLGADLTLVTFEKPADIERREAMAAIKESLAQSGVWWVALRYHKRPKLPATCFDFVHGVARGLAARLRTRFDIVHARTFVGGLMGMALAPVLDAKLIYHNEGFYPDEQVDAGVWQADSTPHRVAKSLEARMYSRADAVIALTNRAKREIENLPAVRRKSTPVIKVPSCVDLDLFPPIDSSPPVNGGVTRLIYAGNVEGRYRFDAIARFVSIASRELGRAHLRVLTAAEPGAVNRLLGAGGLAEGSWSVDKVPREAMPAELASASAGFNFLQQGISERGCSPTKVGEYWAAGIPTVCNANVGDVEEVIRQERVGVIVDRYTDEAYVRAAKELRVLLEDGQLRDRCRRAAQAHYALEPFCEQQFALYREVTAREGAGSLARSHV